VLSAAGEHWWQLLRSAVEGDADSEVIDVDSGNESVEEESSTVDSTAQDSAGQRMSDQSRMETSDGSAEEEYLSADDGGSERTGRPGGDGSEDDSGEDDDVLSDSTYSSQNFGTNTGRGQESGDIEPSGDQGSSSVRVEVFWYGSDCFCSMCSLLTLA
jgi:hypothetical protein